MFSLRRFIIQLKIIVNLWIMDDGGWICWNIWIWFICMNVCMSVWVSACVYAFTYIMYVYVCIYVCINHGAAFSLHFGQVFNLAFCVYPSSQAISPCSPFRDCEHWWMVGVGTPARALSIRCPPFLLPYIYNRPNTEPTPTNRRSNVPTFSFSRS